MSLARHLVDAAIVSRPDMDRAERHAAQSNIPLVQALRRLGVGEPTLIAREVASMHGLPTLGERQWPQSLAFAGDLSKSYLRDNAVLPIAIADSGAVVVAVADPGNARAIDALRVALGRPVELRVAATDDIEAAIDRLSAGEADSLPVANGRGANSEALGPAEGGDDIAQLRDLALGAPVVRLVNQLLVDALRTRATDIHIEPARNRLIVRLRVDGVLRELRSPPPELARAIVSRIKILSGLDIAERRLPQDGRARVAVDGRQLDLRVATVPTVNGEAVAIRLLENAQRALDLTQLGFDGEAQAVLRRYLAAPHGLVLVTGPTGSGKTTTLAAALSILNEPSRKILTIEDPVEYQIDGINQVQVKPEIGVSFAHTLRAFLRNDPDVIMVGELRDTETARVAVQAALTGHLVLSTLHTNSAPGAVTRLLDMGVDGYLVASCLRLVIAQRLVRTLCGSCRQPISAPMDLPRDMLLRAGLEPERPHAHWRAVGCDRCSGTGYLGRTGLIEMMQVDEGLQRLIKPDVTARDVTAAAEQGGYRPLAVDGIGKCLGGVTTPDEVRRVAQDL